MTITVTLKHHGAGTLGSTDRITANNFDYGVKEPNLTAAIAKVLGYAQAVDKHGMPIAASSITTNSTQLAAIVAKQHAGKIGPYPLTFSTPDGTSVTITVTLRDSGGGTPGSTEHITGDNFTYHVDKATLTGTLAQQLGFVKAVDKDGNPIAAGSITVNAAELSAIVAKQNAKKNGTFPLTFSTPDGTSVTIKVTLIGEKAVAGSGNAAAGSGGRAPRTGDSANVVLWILLAALSGTVILVLVIGKIRKRKHNSETE